ncbi:4497_t:CDS:1, partial [Entrophospora sp. SA101]
PDEAEILKQNPIRSFTDNMTLQRHYLWKIYASGDIGGKDDIRNWGMNNDDWIKLCNIDFVKTYNNPEPLQHFRRLAYYRRQGSDEVKALENLKIKEAMQWEESQDSMNPASNDLHKFYSVKQWEAVRDLFQSIGFSGIDDTKILSGDDVAKAFEQSCEEVVKIREDARLLFGFKTRAKGTPDLNATIKFINAIAGNWCGYTVKSDETRVGSKGHQVRKRTYWIDHKAYDGCGFETLEEIRAIKVNNSKYLPIAPIIPPYKPEPIDETQKLFDSIPTTDITTSEEAKLRCSTSSINEVCKESSCHNVIEESMTNLLQSPSTISTQDQLNDFEQFSSITETKKEILEPLITKRLPPEISLSSEYLIKNESDIDILILLLQQKYQMSQEKLDQWRRKITFEFRDNTSYWKKERESMNEIDFLEHKRNFEAKMKVPTTPHKKELKNKSLAIIEYA